MSKGRETTILECGACGNTGWKYVKSFADGQVQVQCTSTTCEQRIKVTPPLMCIHSDGTISKVEYNAEHVKKGAQAHDPTEQFVTVSFRCRKYIRERFQYAMGLIRLDKDISERGIYPETALEFMVENAIQEWEHQVPSEARELLAANFDFDDTAPIDPNQTTLFPDADKADEEEQEGEEE